MTIRRV